MSTIYNNAVGPHVRTPQPKPGLVIPFLACSSLVFGLQWATYSCRDSGDRHDHG